MDRALRWLQTMENYGLTPNAVCLHNMVDAPERAEAWLRRIHSLGLPSSKVPYTMVAQAHAERGNYLEAERILDDMQATNLRMDSQCLKALLSAYANARPRQSQRAETAFCNYLREMKSHTISGPALGALRRAVGGKRASAMLKEHKVE